MWQRAQKLSIRGPGRDRAWREVPMSNSEEHAFSLANGLCRARAVPSGGAGTEQWPSVDVWRAESRKGGGQIGSRHALDIMEPFHSSKIRLWHDWHCPGLPTFCQYSSNGGGGNCASATNWGAASGMGVGGC